MPKVVTAGILIRKGRVLVARRAPGEKQAGKWEFPGGKVEDGESDAQCLELELYEELGIVGKAQEHFCDSYYPYPNGEILLRCYFYQWTANEMAKEGSTCEDILTFFFEGTVINTEIQETELL